MKYVKKCLLLILSFLLVGCVSNKYIEHKQYLLEIPAAPRKEKTSYVCSVFADRTVAIAPFDQLDFLYRIKSNRYLIDYYHGFFTLPEEQLDEILRAYLKIYGHFGLDVTKFATSQNRLEVKLTELYADYRNHDNPQAVVAMRFILTKLVGNKTVVLVDKLLRSNITLKAKNTESLLQGWNEGIKDIIRQGAQILNRKVRC